MSQEGKNILILRGWGSRLKNWQRAAFLLEERGYKVYSPDLPGFGETPAPKIAWSVGDYAAWVDDFCEKNGLSHIFLLGASFGGGIAVKYFLKRPQNVEKIILSGPAIVREKKEIKGGTGMAKKMSFIPFYSFIRKIFYRRILKSDYPLEEGAMKETYLKVIDEDLTGYLSQINVPVKIIWGENDTATPVKYANLVKEKIPGAELEIFPGIGHNPHSQAPEKFVESVATFLEKCQ